MLKIIDNFAWMGINMHFTIVLIYQTCSLHSNSWKGSGNDKLPLRNKQRIGYD